MRHEAAQMGVGPGFAWVSLWIEICALSGRELGKVLRELMCLPSHIWSLWLLCAEAWGGERVALGIGNSPRRPPPWSGWPRWSWHEGWS